jgi:hypothetical protein
MARVKFPILKASISKSLAVAAIAAGLGSMAHVSAYAQNAATVMASNPNLADWTHIVQLAGLNTAAATNTLTIFAVTNKGFENINTMWHGVLKSPGANGSPNFQRMARLVRSQAILGLHPQSDFTGKVVQLTSVAGTPITVDASEPGKVTVTAAYTTGYVTATPQVTTQAIIYPVETTSIHP